MNSFFLAWRRARAQKKLQKAVHDYQHWVATDYPFDPAREKRLRARVEKANHAVTKLNTTA